MEHSSWHALIKEQLPKGYFYSNQSLYGAGLCLWNCIPAQGKGFSGTFDHTSRRG